ncbi:MAG: ComF family protein [Thermodesulfobacteriota bacterium]
MGIYRGVLADALQRFKYHGDISLAGVLGSLWKRISLNGNSFEAVIPVPLHRARLRQRGFNQSLLLGKSLGKMHKIRVLSDALQRIRNTVPQVDLGLSERARNVRGAFAVSRPKEIRDKDLILVDDVFTTGATVNECAKVLKRSGARSVFVLTLARTGVE